MSTALFFLFCPVWNVFAFLKTVISNFKSRDEVFELDSSRSRQVAVTYFCEDGGET